MNSTYNLRNPLTIFQFAHLPICSQFAFLLLANSDFRTARLQKFDCWFHKLFRFSQILQRFSQTCLFLEPISVVGYYRFSLWSPKQRRRSKKSSNIADSSKSLILACCGTDLQCKKCTVRSRNLKLFIIAKLRMLTYEI